jgi:SAM-dependent methyltransferase
MSDDVASVPGVNAQQRQYWNTAGEKWRIHQAELDRHLAAITERLLARAAAAPGERVIDVGCGAGSSTFRLAGAVGDGRVLGIDVSTPLLDAARQRAAVDGIDNAEFVLADAQVHAFPAEAYDLVASRFGVMFFDDPAAAFRNLARALRSGGRFAFASWGPLEENPWFLVPQRSAARHLGPAEPQPPHAPGPLAFSDAAHVEGLLRAAGLEAVEVAAERIVLDGGDSLQALAEFSASFGPAARRIAEAGAAPETVARIAQDIAEALRPYAGREGVRIPAMVNFISARRL